MKAKALLPDLPLGIDWEKLAENVHCKRSEWPATTFPVRKLLGWTETVEPGTRAWVVCLLGTVEPGAWAGVVCWEGTVKPVAWVGVVCWLGTVMPVAWAGIYWTGTVELRVVCWTGTVEPEVNAVHVFFFFFLFALLNPIITILNTAYTAYTIYNIHTILTILTILIAYIANNTTVFKHYYISYASSTQLHRKKLI